MKGSHLPILIVAALLISASSKDPRTDQHKGRATEQTKAATQGQPEPSIPLAVYNSTHADLLEALRTIRTQEEAAAKQKRSEYEPWYAPTVVVQILLVIVGCFYTRYAWKQLAAIKEQAEIARQSLLLQFRPKLTVRNVVIREISNEFPPPPIIREHQAIVGQLYISNTGEMPATITEVGCWVEWNQILPMRRPYEGKDGTKLKAAKILQPSESTPWPFDSITLMDSRARQIMAAEAGWALYVMGWVEYLDDLKTRRRTAFCRKYDITKTRFVKVDDADYEHQE